MLSKKTQAVFLIKTLLFFPRYFQKRKIEQTAPFISIGALHVISATIPHDGVRVSGAYDLMDKPLLKLSQVAKTRLKILFLAKWAESDGRPDSADGTHATYHVEIREILKNIGLNVEASGRYERLFEKPNYDYLFTLFNRGGFLNSEMLAPLLARFNRTPHFGASPIIRGLSDDKHLMKLAARGRGVVTPDWKIYRQGGLDQSPPYFSWQRLIVKPNASSASWGIKICNSWSDALEHMHNLMTEGHDVIIENFIQGFELAVPIVGNLEGPWVMPIIRFDAGNDDAVRSYAQKRHLEGEDKIKLFISDDETLNARLHAAVAAVLPEIWPFDFGRFEFKYDPDLDQLYFIELNLSCNLWSKKATGIGFSSLGHPHSALVETILCHSLYRQNVITRDEIIACPL